MSHTKKLLLAINDLTPKEEKVFQQFVAVMQEQGIDCALDLLSIQPVIIGLCYGVSGETEGLLLDETQRKEQLNYYGVMFGCSQRHQWLVRGGMKRELQHLSHGLESDYGLCKDKKGHWSVWVNKERCYCYLTDELTTGKLLGFLQQEEKEVCVLSQRIRRRWFLGWGMRRQLVM